jgi:hypothetical protein
MLNLREEGRTFPAPLLVLPPPIPAESVSTYLSGSDFFHRHHHHALGRLYRTRSSRSKVSSQ